MSIEETLALKRRGFFVSIICVESREKRLSIVPRLPRGLPWGRSNRDFEMWLGAVASETTKPQQPPL